MAAAVLVTLGGPPTGRRGTVALMAEEDPDSGLTGSLTTRQRDIIDRAYRLALHALS